MKIESVLKRSPESEAATRSAGLEGMRIWSGRVGHKTVCLSYDERNDLWQSSIKMNMGGTKYCSPHGFATRQEALEALEKEVW